MRKNAILILFLICSLVWIGALSSDSGSNLEIIACDVGQGDAILIQQQENQILIDGGPDSKVLDCLGKYMPYWDRKIELVVNTHPEKDHAGGLIDVLDSYEVETIILNDLSKPIFSSSIIRALQSKVGGSDARVVKPTKNTKLRLGLIHLDILHPYDDYKNSNANNHSVVIFLKYIDFEAIFAGDIEDRVSDEIAKNWNMGEVEYIKIPHHGSKNGVSEKLIQTTNPKAAIVSVGKNPYGHPHQEVINLLEKYNQKILRTDQIGDIVIETNGNGFWLKN